MAELIDEDPYLLVRVPALFNNRWQAFHVADKITKHEGKSQFNEKRVNGIIAHLLWEEVEKGHVFMYRSQLPMIKNYGLAGTPITVLSASVS